MKTNSTMNHPWLSDATRKLQSEAAALIQTVNTAKAEADKLLASDKGNIETATDALAKVRARQEVAAARLGRVRESLFASVIDDARKASAAVVVDVQAAAQSKRDMLDRWRMQVKADTKDKAAQEKQIIDTRFWPSELRTAADGVRIAREQSNIVNKVLVAVDWPSHKAAQDRQAAIPCDGWKNERSFWTAAAKYAPELVD